MKVYWIDKRSQIEALILPIRHDIIDRLSAMGPMSARDLARALGRKQTAIYHHLKRLEKLELVRARSVENKRGRPALIYETVAPLMRLARAGRKPENRKALGRTARSVALQTARDYARGFERKHWALEGPERNHWLFRVYSRPSPERLARINALFDELGELLWTPDPRPGEPITALWLLAPLAAAPEAARKPKRRR
jgi:predicted ArsR family transcriptional regulator